MNIQVKAITSCHSDKLNVDGIWEAKTIVVNKNRFSEHVSEMMIQAFLDSLEYVESQVQNPKPHTTS